MPGSKYITYSKSWENVAETIFNSSSFGNELERTGYFEEDLEVKLQGAQGEREKANRILAFVKNRSPCAFLKISDPLSI